MKDDSYSPDLEIDENGKVVAARDIKKHEVISIPMHMRRRIYANGLADSLDDDDGKR